MARVNSFGLKVESSEVVGLADRLGRLSGTAFGLAAVAAVNDVTTRFDETARGGMTADIALTPAYVRSKTDVALAVNPAAPRAEILTRGDLTILGRYDVQQLYKPAGPAWENPKRGTYRGGPSKGDAKRGIPPGSKQAGLRVTVKRSAPTTQAKWFTMTLRRGEGPGANTGVFVRTSLGDKPKHVYGPSPYSLFRYQVLTRLPALESDLERTAVDRVSAAINKALA